MRKYKRLFVLLAFLWSCESKNNNQDFTPELINVTVPEELMVDYHQVFDEYKLVPLTNEEASLIGSIDRIIIHDERFHILDKQTNSIKIFDNDGRFIQRIQELGNGPGEYHELMDFSIDEKGERLVLHSHRPYKLLYYSFDGDFIKEEGMESYYNNIAIDEEYLLMVNLLKENNHLVFLKNLNTDQLKEFLPIGGTERALNNNFGTGFPYCLNSQYTYAFFPFSNIIYQVTNGKLVSRYQIDFGDKNLPELFFKDGVVDMEAYHKAIENKYGFMIANFKESEDYLVFTFGASNIVVYSKREKKSTVFNYAHNAEALLGFQNYFGHDGQYDNYLIGIIQPFNFLYQMNLYRKDIKEWERVPAYLKELSETINDQSNPILMIAKLKQPTI